MPEAPRASNGPRPAARREMPAAAQPPPLDHRRHTASRSTSPTVLAASLEPEKREMTIQRAQRPLLRLRPAQARRPPEQRRLATPWTTAAVPGLNPIGLPQPRRSRAAEPLPTSGRLCRSRVSFSRVRGATGAASVAACVVALAVAPGCSAGTAAGCCDSMRIGCSSSRPLGISCTSRNERPATAAAAASGCRWRIGAGEFEQLRESRRPRGAPVPRAMPCATRHQSCCRIRRPRPGARSSLQVLQRCAQPAVRIAQPALDGLGRRTAERSDLPQAKATLDVQQEGVALCGRYGLERSDESLARLDVHRRRERAGLVSRRPSARLRRQTRRLHRRARRSPSRDARASGR